MCNKESEPLVLNCAKIYKKMKKFNSLIIAIYVGLTSFGQIPFNYDVQIVSKTVPNFPGVHSFAHGQANGKWVIIGGRRDGLHARQPFNAIRICQVAR